MCTFIEFSCPADINISKKIDEKTDNYGPLIRNLHIIIGAFGWVPKPLENELQWLGINDIDNFTRKLQVFSMSGTVKVFRTFLKFT